MAQGLRKNPLHGQDRRLPGDQPRAGQVASGGGGQGGGPNQGEARRRRHGDPHRDDATPSGYQQEAIRLRRDRLGGSSEAGTFDEAIVEGDADAAEKKWDDAIREYEAALEFAGKLPGPA